MNTSTEGAGTQHLERGGASAAPFSSSVSERGRWNTQMLSWASTVMPPIWPRIQLLGSGFGHCESTLSPGPSAFDASGARSKAANARAAQVSARAMIIEVLRAACCSVIRRAAGMNVAANVAAFASPRQPTIAPWGCAQPAVNFREDRASTNLLASRAEN